MKYERMSSYVEAHQYDGDAEAAIEFCVSHSDPNQDVSNRPKPMRNLDGISPERTTQIWVEKSQAYCVIGFGDYIVADPDGTGVYPNPREQFEKTHVPWDGISHR